MSSTVLLRNPLADQSAAYSIALHARTRPPAAPDHRAHRHHEPGRDAHRCGDRGMVLADDARPRSLVGDAELVHRVVVGVGDMGATLGIHCLADEVEEIAVRARRHTEDPEIADVADVHWGSRDLRGRPGRLRGAL